MQILAEFWDGIKGEPLDADNPKGDWWLVAVMLMFPACAIIEAVLR